MNSCWEQEPEARPEFSQLVQSIGKDLQGMTGYLYVSAFDNQEEINKEQPIQLMMLTLIIIDSVITNPVTNIANNFDTYNSVIIANMLKFSLRNIV